MEERQNPKPVKVNDHEYKVDKTGNMNVPLKVFASEPLMEKMLDDKCLQQGVNVACMPGIQGYSEMGIENDWTWA